MRTTVATTAVILAGLFFAHSAMPCTRIDLAPGPPVKILNPDALELPRDVSEKFQKIDKAPFFGDSYSPPQPMGSVWRIAIGKSSNMGQSRIHSTASA